jgi:hypothetical protein
MSGADMTVLVLSVMAVAGLGWYFFAPPQGPHRRTRRRRTEDRGDG